MVMFGPVHAGIHIDTVVTLLDKALKKKGTANYKVRKNIVGNKVSMSLPILSYPIRSSHP